MDVRKLIRRIIESPRSTEQKIDRLVEVVILDKHESMERIVQRLEKLKAYEACGDCPRDGMCDKKLHECTSCYSSTAIEIVTEELN